MKKILILCSVSLSVLLIDACQQSVDVKDSPSSSARSVNVDLPANVDQSVTGDYQVRNGMLYFKSAQAFFDLEKSHKGQDLTKRLEFTKNINFSSLTDALLNAQKLLNKAETIDQYKQVLQDNSDILKNDLNGSSSVFTSLSTELLNREGMVSIGGRIHLFGKDKTVIGDDLAKVRTSFKNNRKVDDSILIISTNGGTNAKARGIYSCSSIDRTAQNSDGNRRAEVQINVYRRAINVSGTTNNTVEYYVNIQGIPTKKNFFGNWVGYDTGNLLNSRIDVSVTVFVHDYNYYYDYYQTTTAQIRNESNVDGGGNSYQEVIKSYSNVQTFDLQSDYFSFTDSMTDVSPIGVYSTGGVPDGVNMICN